ncbi:MAG: GerMN domain-containing protein [Terriglobia bacterium]
MPRHIKFGLIALLIITLIGVSFYYDLRKRIQDLVQRPAEPVRPYLATEPVIPESAPLKRVKLFFPSPEKGGQLVPVEREIRSAESNAVEAKQIVAELIKGPGPGYAPALPSETKLRELFILKDGLAVVDLTREVSVNHPGGIAPELASIYSLVNSLAQNVARVKTVQILIEGSEVETLAGHIDISHPLTEDLSIASLASVSARSTDHASDRSGTRSGRSRKDLICRRFWASRVQ